MVNQEVLIAKYQERPIKRVVVKIGSGSTVDRRGFKKNFIMDIVNQMTVLHAQSIDVALVSSGAIPLGRIKDPSLRQPDSIVDTQLAAALGQASLQNEWSGAFSLNEILAPQFLLTDQVLTVTKPVLRRALEKRHIPIINGNDAVASPRDEKNIVARDNDLLAQNVAGAVGADSIVFLTEAEGVLNDDREVVRFLRYNEPVSLLRAPRSAIGRGGIESKLDAARAFVRPKNQYTLDRIAFIASSEAPDVLTNLFIEKTPVGTMVHPW